MDCARTTELLPWLLNGTLGEEERREVRRHLVTCEGCRRALADTRLAWEVFDQHLSPEVLVSLAWGEEPAGLDPALAELHLASCPQCAAELELARTSRHLEEDDRIAVLTPRTPPRSTGSRQAFRGWRSAALAAGLAGVVAATGWFQTAQRARTLEDALAERPAITEPATPAEPRPSVPVPSTPAGGTTERDRVAALEKQLEEMRRTTAEMQKRESELRGEIGRLAQATPDGPRINTLVLDLSPIAAVVRGNDQATRIPADADATLILGSDPGGKAYPAYDVEILDTDDAVRWRERGLRRHSGTNDYTLTLPSGSLPPGAYTIRLYGRSGETREAAERYALRVE